MPVIQHERRQLEQIILALGANPRPHDPRSEKYQFPKLITPRTTPDLTKPKLLSDRDGVDHRPPITNQGNVGACTAFTVEEINYILSSIDGNAQSIHPGWVYEQERKFEGTWPSDAGANEADGLDIVMKRGAPLLSAMPYVDQAGYDYSSIDTQANTANVYIQTHMPITIDAQLLENIWTAIDLDQPCALAMSWLRPFFSPSGGKLPDNANVADVAGGHEITIWGIVPGFVLCCNHWTTGWSADAASFGYTMRPGDFAIPWSYFQAPPAQSIIWDVRACTARVIQPQPNPQPNPKPQPNPQPQPTPANTDAYWAWLRRESYVVSQKSESVRTQQASVVVKTTRQWYPNAGDNA